MIAPTAASGTIRLFVPGRPRPAGSKRAFVNPRTGKAIVVDANPLAADWKTRVAELAYRRIVAPLQGPVAFRFTFTFTRPLGHYGTGKNATTLKESAPAYPTGPPDTTKLVRAAEDALAGVAWLNDSQVVEQRAAKRYGARPGVLIEIRPMDPRGLDGEGP